MTKVRTRFAPSPTGYMHIGGMRSALFAWLWARHNGGEFVLRIDDTDQQRNVAEALQPILDAFRWLGLDWDEGPEVGGPYEPYFQSQRGAIYAEALRRLLEEGKAFRDFDPPEVTQSDREAAENEKRNYLNVRRSLELSDDEVATKLAADEPHVVRLLMPRGEGRVLKINDAILGDVEWNVSEMPDPVLARKDGSPLYNFASVVDDAAMEMTHVIRAQEHLSNLPVQHLIRESLGYDTPVYAHIPFVTAPGSSKKLSKRDANKLRKNPAMKPMFDAADVTFPLLGLDADGDGMHPVAVAWYEAMGYLPEAVFNFLARLGWSLDGETEIMSRETVVENFTLDRVVKAPAAIDPDKLKSFQQHWTGELSLEAKTEGVLPFLTKAGYVAEPVTDETREHVARVLKAMNDRLVVFSDVLKFDEFFVADDRMEYEEKAFRKRVAKEGAADRLRAFRDSLATVEPFDALTTEEAMKSWCESNDVKLGDVIHAVRVATTGKGQGVGMFDALAILGRDRCLARIDRTLDRVG